MQGAIESAISTLTRFKTPGDHGGHLRRLGGHREQPDGQHRRRRSASPFPSATVATQRSNSLSWRTWSTRSRMACFDRSEAAYGIASGKRIHVQEHLVSNIMGSTGKVASQHSVSSASLRKRRTISSRATEHACDYWPTELEYPGHHHRRSRRTKDYVVKQEYFHHEITRNRCHLRRGLFESGSGNSWTTWEPHAGD